jgi:glycerate-2-kinase
VVTVPGDDRLVGNREALCDHGRADARATLCAVAGEAVRAVHPTETVPRHLDRAGSTLRVDDAVYDLAEVETHLLAVGKGAGAVASAVTEVLGDHLADGIVVGKHGESTDLDDRFESYAAGHPIPDEPGATAAARVRSWADARSESDLVVACITGGASALLPAPAGDVTLSDLAAVTDALLSAGAPIEDVNAVRKHLSTLKGGRLADLVAPASLLTLVVVDEVAGDPWGPTVPDDSTFEEAVDALRRHGLWETVPETVRARLRAGVDGAVPETPTAAALGDRRRTVVLADADDCCRAAAAAAERRGYDTAVLSTTVEGESREAATVLSAIAREADDYGRPLAPPCVFVTGGETTVTLDGDAGEGGPNGEFALAAARALAGRPVTVLALGTDGTDGPTDLAGGLVDGETVARAAERGVDVEAALAGHDTATALRALDDAVVTGGTGTNVMDLRLFLVEPA